MKTWVFFDYVKACVIQVDDVIDEADAVEKATIKWKEKFGHPNGKLLYPLKADQPEKRNEDHCAH